MVIMTGNTRTLKEIAQANPWIRLFEVVTKEGFAKRVDVYRNFSGNDPDEVEVYHIVTCLSDVQAEEFAVVIAH